MCVCARAHACVREERGEREREREREREKQRQRQRDHRPDGQADRHFRQTVTLTDKDRQTD